MNIEDNNEKAFLMLKEKGFKTSEQFFIRNSFTDTYREEFPFISTKHRKLNGKPKTYFYSTIDDSRISSLGFENEDEVKLANALYENMKGEKFNLNDFYSMLNNDF